MKKPPPIQAYVVTVFAKAVPPRTRKDKQVGVCALTATCQAEAETNALLALTSPTALLETPHYCTVVPLTWGYLPRFPRAYLETALWAETTGDKDPVELDSKYGIEAFTPEALVRAWNDCARFQLEQARDLRKAYKRYVVTDGTSPEAYAAHDFWLTRNGHGAGFWDRGFGELGKRLTAACAKFGTCNVYAGSKGRLSLE